MNDREQQDLLLPAVLPSTKFYNMELLENAKQEFEKKLSEITNEKINTTVPHAKEYVIYAKLMELQNEIEKLKTGK